jgi:predicted lipid-binding transport protein (Tim44 family)
MKFSRSMASMVLATAVLAGCEQQESTSDSATPPASPAAAPTPAATPDASSTGGDAAAQTAATAETPTTAPAAGTASAAEVTQAQTLLDQTVTYVKENKMDLAEKSLAQLEQLKPKLPVEYHSKIDGARKAFNAAKSGQGLKLDGLLPSGGK